MLRTAFIGNDNFYDRKICEWLSEHTELSLIIWTDKLTWSYNDDGRRRERIKKRFLTRSKKLGKMRAADEFLYYILYRAFIGQGDLAKVKSAVKTINTQPKKDLSQIEQIRTDDIKSKDLLRSVEEANLDAMFAMCIDAYLPSNLIDTPRLGTFLWHEGITPDYRGVYSPFWALVNKDYDNLGYTLLRMNSKLDAGEVYVQGKAEDIDLVNDWHSYIGHKAVLDSLPKVESFLKDLNENKHRPIDRSNAKDGYYSYPTASSLIKLMVTRKLFKRSIPQAAAKNGK
jgi:Formyl transferase